MLGSKPTLVPFLCGTQFLFMFYGKDFYLARHAHFALCFICMVFTKTISVAFMDLAYFLFCAFCQLLTQVMVSAMARIAQRQPIFLNVEQFWIFFS